MSPGYSSAQTVSDLRQTVQQSAGGAECIGCVWCVCEGEVEVVGWRGGEGEGIQTRTQGKMGMLMYVQVHKGKE